MNAVELRGENLTLEGFDILTVLSHMLEEIWPIRIFSHQKGSVITILHSNLHRNLLISAILKDITC